MKILYYSPHPHLKLKEPTGYGTHMREMINAFRSLGHDVFPLIMEGDKKIVNSYNKNKNSLNLKNVARLLTPRIIWETTRDYNLLRLDRKYTDILSKKINEIKPDLIYERANYMQLSGVTAAQKFGIHHIIEMNSPYVELRRTLSSRSFLEGKAAQIERIQLENTNKIAIVSSALMNHFIEKYNIDAKNFIITPMGINPDSIKTDEHKIQELKYNYNLNDKFVIGFVGSVFKWHGIDMLIKAFVPVLKREPTARLMIVGGGSQLEFLRKMAKDISVYDNIIFTGFIPHEMIYNYISLMDITVLPNSHWWGIPVKIFEYGALGKPIIAPNISTITDVMVNGKDGILIEPHIDELIDSIRYLIENKEVCNSIGNNFKDKVYSKFKWEKIASDIIQS